MAESAQIDPGDGSHTDLYPSELQALKAEVRKSSDDLVLERLARALPALGRHNAAPQRVGVELRELQGQRLAPALSARYGPR